jgi:hypothetical protein
MAETTTQPEDKKTVVAFIVGLLIGGLLVWAFSGPTADAPEKTERNDETTKTADSNTTAKENDTGVEKVEVTTETNADTPAITILPTGEGSVTVGSVSAGNSVPLGDVTYPIEEGWIGVRTYQGERLGYILGVVRFSKRDGLVPSEIVLQTPTRSGSPYAIVMYTESGDRTFNLATDTQVDKVFATFTAK